MGRSRALVNVRQSGAQCVTRLSLVCLVSATQFALTRTSCLSPSRLVSQASPTISCLLRPPAWQARFAAAGPPSPPGTSKSLLLFQGPADDARGAGSPLGEHASRQLCGAQPSGFFLQSMLRRLPLHHSQRCSLEFGHGSLHPLDW